MAIGKFNRGPGSPWRKAMEARRGVKRGPRKPPAAAAETPAPGSIAGVDADIEKMPSSPPMKRLPRGRGVLWDKSHDSLDRAIAELLSDRDLRPISSWRGERSRFPERYQ